MTQSIIYSKYKFDITVGQSSVDIQVFDTTSHNKYAGTVNEHEIYVTPIGKFVKLLTGALENQPDFSIGIVKLPDKLKCQLTYKTDFIELEEIFALDKQVCSLEQFEISIVQMEKLKLEQVNKQYQAKVAELNARVQELEAEISAHSSVDIESKIQMLQQMELDTLKRIKQMELDLKFKEEETEKKILEKTTRVTNELNLQEKRLTDRIIAFEQRELNNLLPKVAEKDTAFDSFVHKVLNNGGYINCQEYQKKITNLISSIVSNDKEYIIFFENDYTYITNYGKVFLRRTLQSWGGPTYSVFNYCDLKINVINKLLLEIIKFASEPKQTCIPGLGNHLENPCIAKLQTELA